MRGTESRAIIRVGQAVSDFLVPAVQENCKVACRRRKSLSDGREATITKRLMACQTDFAILLPGSRRLLTAVQPRGRMRLGFLGEDWLGSTPTMQ